MNDSNNSSLVQYLQMIQEPISRMSMISSVLKGFAATTITASTTLLLESSNVVILIVLFVPLFSFMSLDIYYLILERKFRYLFDRVRKGEHDIDYSLKFSNDSSEQQNARIRDCLKSPSIWIFYGSLVGFLTIMVLLKLFGVC